MLQSKREFLQNYSKIFIPKLKKLHRNFSKTHIYPTDKRVRTAIYDSDKIKIFSLLKTKPDLEKALYEKNGEIHFIKEPEEYYLGAKYIVFEIDDDRVWLKEFYKKIIFYGIPMFALIIVVGYFLMRLFLKPMRDSILLLDRFIKDTTHELNTPVSAILANIETIDKKECSEKNIKKINRINIAAKTISNIYQDLTYLVLNHKLQKDDKHINLSSLLKDRCEYFKEIAKSKKINFILDIKDDVKLYIDKNRAAKLIDNLISNAIKYNKINGEIKITLRENYLSVKDTGIGIKNEKLEEIFDRYKRFNDVSGGFGIGLNIVWMIAKEYNLNIKVDSKEGKYTEVRVEW
jgi:two-component system OmpR family sensor kinase